MLITSVILQYDIHCMPLQMFKMLCCRADIILFYGQCFYNIVIVRKHLNVFSVLRIHNKFIAHAYYYIRRETMCIIIY